MTFLQIHALNKEIANCPDMTLETKNGIRSEIKGGKLYTWSLYSHNPTIIYAGLFRYRHLIKDKGLDQNALTDEIMEEIRWKKLTLTT